MSRITVYLFFIYSLLQVIFSAYRKKVIILGSPYHKNLGDHAQTYSTINWIKEYYNNHAIVCLDTQSAIKYNYLLLRIIKLVLRNDDLIILHSGYHLTDLYPFELSLQLEALQLFSKNKIVFFPQTINFTKKTTVNLVAKALTSADDVTLICRDETSYDTAQKSFKDCQILLFPDIVTSEIGKKSFGSTERAGINLCLRNDIESLYNKDGSSDKLYSRLSKIDDVTRTDTEASQNPFAVRINLSRILNSTWHSFGKYKVTVTDRYHGTIFSLIANTPVVVVSSTDHKLISGVKWFPKDIFGKHVFYAEDIEMAIKIVKALYKESPLNLSSRYFTNNYYSKLKHEITKSS